MAQMAMGVRRFCGEPFSQPPKLSGMPCNAENWVKGLGFGV